jgi:hypothetical protein
MRASIVTILLLTFLAGNLFCQNTVVINGYVETLENIPISGVTAELFEGNNKVKTTLTNSDGLFSFSLSYDKSYKVVVSKSGLIQKRIDFNTSTPADQQRKLIKEFAMTLVENCQGANTSVFEEPVDIVEYDNGFGNFVSNKAYFEKMQSRISSAYQDIEKCKQDSYTADKKAADQAMSDGKFEEAKKLYQEALQIFPNDSYAKKQIIQANKNIAGKDQEKAKYDQLIKEADQYMAQNQLTAAKQRYSDAQKVNPNDEYAKKKIEEISSALAQQAEQVRKEQAINNQFNDIVTKANAAMAAKNYPVAKQLYEEASKLKPTDAFPAQKIAEAQQAMQKIEQQKVDQQNNEKAYLDALQQGQAAMQQGNYALAQQNFQKALTYKPNESLPRQNIVEAQRQDALKKQQDLQAQKSEVDRQYNEAIQKADGLLVQKDFENAITAYKQALSIKPSDSYAQSQITKTQNLLVDAQQSQQVAKEQAYNQAITLGDAKKLNKEYEAAIAAYQQALVSKPNDGAAQNKLSESQKLLTAQQAQLKADLNVKAKYNQLIQEGDGFFTSKQLVEAKNKYQQALTIYPQEIYPKNQIAAIDNANAKTQKEADYNKIIVLADQLFTQKKYEDAKTQYGLAAQVIPEKTYPQQKINEINSLIAGESKKALQDKYNGLAAQAEQQIAAKNYDQAKSLYSQAQQVMPENPYPRQRINEINTMIDNQAKTKLEEQYNQLITKADGLFNQKQYDQAKNIYTQAQQDYPDKTYPQQKINEINTIRAGESKKATEDKYNGLAAQAEQQVSLKNYDQAKDFYTQAALVMPENPYPKQRINEINQLISDLGRKKVEDDYNKIITEADGYFAQKNYGDASASYQRALLIKAGQQYPQNQINEINRLLSEAARIDREKLDKQTAYDKTIVLADKYFNDKNYQLARNEYTNAAAIFPEKDYPKTQLTKIEQLLALQQQQNSDKQELDRKFNLAITQADAYFKNKQYPEAKTYYRQANELKPQDVQSASQIKRIEEIMAQQAAEQKRSEDVNKRYTDLIATADSKFGSSDFKEARQLYLSALEVKPNEIYPREQIKKADERLKIIAEAQPVNKVTKVTSGSTKLAELNFKNESERSKYLADLKTKYSEGVTLEIYNEGNKTTKRYIVIRSGEVHEYRDMRFTWGGTQYSVDGKPSNSFYLQSQVKPREGEKYTETEK